MFSKKGRIVWAVVWGLLTIPAGFLAAILWGLVRMDSGWTSPEPQLYAIWALPVVLFTSFFGELMAAQGVDDRQKRQQAKIFFALPILSIIAIAVLVWLRAGN